MFCGTDSQTFFSQGPKEIELVANAHENLLKTLVLHHKKYGHNSLNAASQKVLCILLLPRFFFL